MKMVLKNGLNVSADAFLFNEVRQVAASLEPLNMQGYAVVSFYENGHAQEVCVSPSSGFVSIKNYQNNQLKSEMFRDVLHQKTFYYSYEEGRAVETSLDSQNKEWECNVAMPREIMMHAPVSLFEALKGAPQKIIHNKVPLSKMARSKYKERTRTAA